MGDHTAIEWTEATWNPVTGCTKVSPGCDHCYAETLAERFRGTPGHYYEHGFDVQLRPGKLNLPLRWTRPRRIFVNSMSDLFHDEVPDEYIAQVFAVMAGAPRHTFQVLTKRHGRMRALLNDRDFLASMWQWCVEFVGGERADALWGGSEEVPWPLPNVWLGVSAENQQWAEARIPALLETPAAVRWVSAEPLLGAIDLRNLTMPRRYGSALLDALAGDVKDHHQVVYAAAPGHIAWVVAGGESGRGARPMHPDWARSLRDQCAATRRAFLFKQWGEWAPIRALGEHQERVGKKAAGRELDGQLHDGYPR